jgi:hypothetical protein
MKKAIKNSGFVFSTVVMISFAASCSQKLVAPSDSVGQEDAFMSQEYGHFEGGVLFSDVEHGLHVLWHASFRNRKVYKENIGFFVEGGILILPNKDNTQTASRINALPIVPSNNKIYVEFNGQYMEILGIVHTHPNPYGSQVPTSGSDFQFTYLGIHSYVIAVGDVYDAFRDRKGQETFERIGSRNSLATIPFTNSLPRLYASNYRKAQQQ